MSARDLMARAEAWRDAALEACEQAWLWVMLPCVALIIAAIAAALALALGFGVVSLWDALT